MPAKIHFTLTIPPELAGVRLDQALAKLLPDYSRTQIQQWIKNANITVDKNGNTCSAGGGSIMGRTYHGFLRNGYLDEC